MDDPSGCPELLELYQNKQPFIMRIKKLNPKTGIERSNNNNNRNIEDTSVVMCDGS